MKWPEELNFIPNGRKPQHTSNEDMTGKTIVISGASSGVGLAATKRFLQANARVIMVVRNRDKAEQIKNELRTISTNIDIVLADFSNLDSVQSAAKSIVERNEKIDVLINSVGMHSTKKRYTTDGREMVFMVNHLGPFLFTKLLIPFLTSNAPAKIIQVNSEGHRFSTVHIDDLDWKKHWYTGLRGYGMSKTAQLLTVWEFADQLQGSGVTINAMHPGAVKSAIGSNNGFLYRLFNKLFVWYTLKDPEISGEALFYLASSQTDGITGTFYNLTNEEIPAKHARNRELGKQLFDMSNKLTTR